MAFHCTAAAEWPLTPWGLSQHRRRPPPQPAPRPGDPGPPRAQVEGAGACAAAFGARRRAGVSPLLAPWSLPPPSHPAPEASRPAALRPGAVPGAGGRRTPGARRNRTAEEKEERGVGGERKGRRGRRLGQSGPRGRGGRLGRGAPRPPPRRLAGCRGSAAPPIPGAGPGRSAAPTEGQARSSSRGVPGARGHARVDGPQWAASRALLRPRARAPSPPAPGPPARADQPSPRHTSQLTGLDSARVRANLCLRPPLLTVPQSLFIPTQPLTSSF